MKITSRTALVLAAVLVSTAALAQRPSSGSRGGGGGPRVSGGPRMSGGPRVSAPRGGPVVAPRGSYSGRGGYYGRGYSGGGRGYGRYPIRPYYPYRYPYYRPYYPIGWYGWGAGWGWGWGGWWGYSPWWGGYGYGYPGYGYGSGYGGYGYAPGGYVSVSSAPGRWAGVKTDVSPEEACIFLDGRFIGTADDFDGYPDLLYLQAKGHYKLEFQLEGFEPQTIDVDALPGALIKIDNKLKKIPGAKQYGSYDTREPEGGVQRYFGKQKDGTTGPNVLEVPVEGEGEWQSPSGGTPSVDGDMPRSIAAAPSTPPSPSTPEPGIVGQAPSSSRGRILFRVEPDDAAVYLDDRFAGTGEELSTLGRGLQVSAGSHRIYVSRPGFESDAVMVDVAPGGSETVEVNLRKP